MHCRTVQSDSKKWGDCSYFHLPVQEDEKQLQDSSSIDKVRENGSKRFGH